MTAYVFIARTAGMPQLVALTDVDPACVLRKSPSGTAHLFPTSRCIVSSCGRFRGGGPPLGKSQFARKLCPYCLAAAQKRGGTE